MFMFESRAYLYPSLTSHNSTTMPKFEMVTILLEKPIIHFPKIGSTPTQLPRVRVSKYKKPQNLGLKK